MGTILCNLVTLKLVYNGLKTQMLILFMSFIIFYFPRPSGGPSINIRCPKLYGGAHSGLKVEKYCNKYLMWDWVVALLG